MSKKSLYCHIPFCDHICGYCDFVRVGYNNDLAEKYLIELRHDLKNINEEVSSIYIGGGTPSSLTIEQLDFLFDSMSHLLSDDIEVTLEANPESLSLEKIKRLKKWGVNRISLGVQSTQDYFLKILGRLHTFENALAVLNNLKNEGLTNVSVDFMYGLPNQSLEDVKVDLLQIIDLNPNHISLYSLTIEPNSEFGRQNIKEVESTLETQMYLLIQDTLVQHGYIHYEISNYCKPGYQSKHNLGYWNYEDFVGLGIGASSKIKQSRYTVDKNLNNYLKGNRNNSEVFNLSDKDLMFEHLMMGLRLKDGLDIDAFNNRHDINVLEYYKSAVDKFTNQKMLEIVDNKIKATDKGRLMLHDILVELMD